MILKLNKIQIENFKGIKSFEVELGGNNATIKAENGVGKTTVYDAFLWLLFGKNSEGKMEFEVRPLDENNQPLKGLVLAVEAEIDCDGTTHIFRKEHHEKIVKRQHRGYETLCTIDEVPKTVSKYSDYITKLIEEDTFKMLTDLKHFNSKLHWSDRRLVLLDIAGEIKKPEGFDALFDVLMNVRRGIKESATSKEISEAVEDYKAVLATRKKRYTEEREEINPRIDEIQRGLDEYAGTDTKGIEEQRDKIRVEMTELDKQRHTLFNTEKDRLAKIDYVNSLEAKKVKRKAELASDTGNIKALLDEKATLEVIVAQKQRSVMQAKTSWTTNQTLTNSAKNNLNSYTASLTEIRDEYKTASEAPTKDTCYACGRKLTEDKLSANKGARSVALERITKRGNDIKADVDKGKNLIVVLEAEFKVIDGILKKATSEFEKAEDTKAERFAEIDEAIENREKKSPGTDDVWNEIYNKIIEARKQVGEPVSEQLQLIDTARTEKADAMAQLDKTLAQADRMKKDKTRIIELEKREKELAQFLADILQQLADIDEYKTKQSQAIESAVNDKFKYVTFKLFNRLLNDSIEDTCEAMLDGVPYKDISYGQKICVGLDVINTLSAHCGISTPIFIDNAEGLTYVVEAQSQVIRLVAAKGVKELSVSVIKKGEMANV